MDKNQMNEFPWKKSLVRNSEKPLPKCKVTTSIDSRPTVSNFAPGQIPTTEITKKTKNKFDSPELYSSLKLSKQIEKIVKPRKTKSCSDVVDHKLAVDEKISRKVNFPYSQPIYKDLIPLTCSQVPQQSIVPSREPFLQKDKEPLLSDFVTPKITTNYYCLPCVKIEVNPTLIASNNLRLYNHLEINR